MEIDAFTAKIIKVGSSKGLLIPANIVKNFKIKARRKYRIKMEEVQDGN